MTDVIFHDENENTFNLRSVICKINSSIVLIYFLANEIKLLMQQGMAYLSDPWNFTDLSLMILYFVFVAVDLLDLNNKSLLIIN